jgi:hypothetical protein
LDPRPEQPVAAAGRRRLLQQRRLQRRRRRRLHAFLTPFGHVERVFLV